MAIDWKNVFFVYQKLKPQYTIFNRAIIMKHHRKNVDPEFQNTAVIVYSLLHDFFYLDLTTDSTALLEDNTLNQCISWFLVCLFCNLKEWRKTLIHWKMKCGNICHLLFKLYETEVGSRSTHLRRIYDKWLLER